VKKTYPQPEFSLTTGGFKSSSLYKQS